MYLNALSATVCPAASPPSGNQLFSSSLCLILSLERPRLKNLLHYLRLYPLISIVHRSRVYSDVHQFGLGLRPNYPTDIRFGNYPYIPCQFVSRSSRPLLLRFIASLVFLCLFELVCSCVSLVLQFVSSLCVPASFTEPVCSCVSFIVSNTFRIYCVSHLF
jgi:hypothetical protein